MRTKDLGPIVISDLGHSRPQFWTIATVGTVHLILSAVLLTSTGPLLEPGFLDNVEIVTLPQTADTQTKAPVPTERNPAPVVPMAEPPQQRVEPPAEIIPVPPPPVEAPIPPPPAPTKQVAPEVPKAPPVLSQANNLKADVAPASVEEVAPIPFKPIAAPLPKPVMLRPASPIVTQPTPDALQLKGQRLKAATAPAVQATPNLQVPDTVEDEEPPPYQPSPLPTLAPASAPNLRTLPNRPITATPTQAAPMALPKSQVGLPKVQVPQIKAADLRVPEEQAAASVSGGNAAAGGTSGGGAASQASAQAGIGTSGGVTSLGGSFAGGGALPSSGGGNQGGSQTTAGSSGALPRRPGGAGVKTEFPTGVGGTLLSKMARTGECAQISRDRDGKCPDWDPIDGRSPRLAKPMPVAVPKDAAPGRYPLGSNPMPLCKPGTPQAQFGLSCLPRDDGPGIPKQ